MSTHPDVCLYPADECTCGGAALDRPRGWAVALPGQPPSTNHMYVIGRGFRRGGIAYPKMVKVDAVVAYQQMTTLITRLAKPREWKWDGGLLVLEFGFYLVDNIDCDNAMKAVCDAISDAIEVNDKWFLPRAMSKVWGLKPADARVEVTIG